MLSKSICDLQESLYIVQWSLFPFEFDSMALKESLQNVRWILCGRTWTGIPGDEKVFWSRSLV